MRNIIRHILVSAGLLVFQMPVWCVATDVAVTKNIVSYIVTLDSISPKYIPKGSGLKATVELTITPTNRAKYSPKSITMYANNIAFPIDINSYSGPGTYVTTLDEGIDLLEAGEYEVQIEVDNAISNILPMYVWEIKSKTKANTPTNTDRRTLGIVEEVDLWISPVLDISGDDISWTVDGGLASLTANKGYLVTFSAGWSPLDAEVSVTIDNGSAKIPFRVVAPESISVPSWTNIGYGAKGPPNNYIGAVTKYDLIVNPITVSFYNATFRENISPYLVTWPSGEITEGAVGVVWNVSEANSAYDNHATGRRPIDYLKDPNSIYVDFGWSGTIINEYINIYGTFVPWGEIENWQSDFRGSDQAARNTYQNHSGSWQGPWQ